MGDPPAACFQVANGSGHNEAIDWWCLGCLLHELRTGGQSGAWQGQPSPRDDGSPKPGGICLSSPQIHLIRRSSGRPTEATTATTSHATCGHWTSCAMNFAQKGVTVAGPKRPQHVTKGCIVAATRASAEWPSVTWMENHRHA